MKHGTLHAIAHNFADSFAGGTSFIFGYSFAPVLEEASQAKDKTLVMDFLLGTVEGANPNGDLAQDILMFKNGFPDFCAKHGANASDFRAFRMRYTARQAGIEYTVTIEDRFGKETSRDYFGSPGKRAQVLDDLGRRRPKKPRTQLA